MKYRYLQKEQTEGETRFYDRFSVDGIAYLVNIESAGRVHLGHRLRGSYKIISEEGNFIKVTGVSKRVRSDLTAIIYGFLM